MAYFDKYGVEFSDDRKTLVKCPKDFQGEYIVPKGVECIGREAFEDCSGLFSIKFPNSLKEIWFYAFGGCTNLHLVIIPSSVEWIGKNAFDFSGEVNVVVWNSKHCRDFEVSMFETITPFSNQEKIVTFVLGEQVEHIPDGLCWRMRFSSITIPSSVISIGNASFLGCVNLQKIVIPKNVIKIGERAFKYCHQLKSIQLPASIKEIGEHAFDECEVLKEIIIPKGHKNRFIKMEGLKELVSKIVEQ
jgi:hypothetical protein